MIKNYAFYKFYASVEMPDPSVGYWIDLTADPKGNIIKFYDHNIKRWAKLTDASSEYAVAPYIGSNGNWWVENRDTGVAAGGKNPYVGENGNWYTFDPVTNAYKDTGVVAKGMSAYDLAVKHGFQGTESEWVESLSKASEDAAEVALEAAEKTETAIRNANTATKEATKQADRAKGYADNPAKIVNGLWYTWDEASDSYKNTNIQAIGDPFEIKKTYASISEMNQDYDNPNIEVGQFVWINTGNVEDPEDSKLYLKGETEWILVGDLSGQQGIQGMSAYDIALQHGFIGTEAEWLQSIKQPAIDAATETLKVKDATEDLAQEIDDAETIREQNETNRITAESLRVQAENTRASNETTRQSQETTRQNAENTRQSQEADRETASIQAVNNANTATTTANNAATSANTAAGNANAAATYANTQGNRAETYANNPPKVDQGYWFVWDEATNAYKNTGWAAAGVNIKGSYDTLEEFLEAAIIGELGDAYMVAGNLYVWNGEEWQNVGTIQGPQGEKGEQGEQGPQGEPGSDADVTKANVEAVLTGDITSHNHDSTYLKDAPTTGGQYVRQNGEWAEVNIPEVDLSNYLAKDNTVEYTPTGNYNPATKKYVDETVAAVDVTSQISGKADKTYVDTQLDTKVDKVTGKGLSTNDYDDVSKGKIDALPSRLVYEFDAQASKKNATNVVLTEKLRVLGNATDATYDITIPAADATYAGVMTSADKVKLDGIAAGAEANVNSDWNATTGDAQILNKPDVVTDIVGVSSNLQGITFNIQRSDGGVEPKQIPLATTTSNGVMSSADKLAISQIDSKINTAIASVYKVKGSVANYEALPTTNVQVGDVYNLTDTGANYVAIEIDPSIVWDKLSETISIDTSDFVTKKENLIPVELMMLDATATSDEIFAIYPLEKWNKLVAEIAGSGNNTAYYISGHSRFIIPTIVVDNSSPESIMIAIYCNTPYGDGFQDMFNQFVYALDSVNGTIFIADVLSAVKGFSDALPSNVEEPFLGYYGLCGAKEVNGAFEYAATPQYTVSASEKVTFDHPYLVNATSNEIEEQLKGEPMIAQAMVENNQTVYGVYTSILPLIYDNVVLKLDGILSSCFNYDDRGYHFMIGDTEYVVKITEDSTTFDLSYSCEVVDRATELFELLTPWIDMNASSVVPTLEQFATLESYCRTDKIKVYSLKEGSLYNGIPVESVSAVKEIDTGNNTILSFILYPNVLYYPYPNYSVLLEITKTANEEITVATLAGLTMMHSEKSGELSIVRSDVSAELGSNGYSPNTPISTSFNFYASGDGTKYLSDDGTYKVVEGAEVSKEKIEEVLTGDITSHEHGSAYSYTAHETDVWDGTSISSSLSGTGTKDDPYLIQSCADLLHVRRDYALYGGDTDMTTLYKSFSKYFKCTKNLDFNNQSIPDFVTDDTVDGIMGAEFNGNRITISNFQLSHSTSMLFAPGMFNCFHDFNFDNFTYTINSNDMGNNYHFNLFCNYFISYSVEYNTCYTNGTITVTGTITSNYTVGLFPYKFYGAITSVSTPESAYNTILKDITNGSYFSTDIEVVDQTTKTNGAILNVDYYYFIPEWLDVTGCILSPSNYTGKDTNGNSQFNNATLHITHTVSSQGLSEAKKPAITKYSHIYFDSTKNANINVEAYASINTQILPPVGYTTAELKTESFVNLLNSTLPHPTFSYVANQYPKYKSEEIKTTYEGYATVEELLKVRAEVAKIDAYAAPFVTASPTTFGVIRTNYINDGDNYAVQTNSDGDAYVALNTMVTSTSIDNIVSMSQSAYNALTTKDSRTFYIITS